MQGSFLGSWGLLIQTAVGARAACGRPPVLDSEELARLRRLHAAGYTQRGIASLLGVGKRTVARALAQPQSEVDAA